MKDEDNSINQTIINSEEPSAEISNGKNASLNDKPSLVSSSSAATLALQAPAVITMAIMQDNAIRAHEEQQAEAPKNNPLATSDESADKVSNSKIGNAYLSQGGITGRYNHQEDRADVEALANYVLTAEQTGQALYNTIMDLGNQYKQEQAGSTFVAAVAYYNQVITANVGDSRAMLVTKRADGKLTCTRLSVEHKVSKASEQERVKKAGGFVFNYRLNGRLAIARAIGDDQPNFIGLTYAPDISYIEVPPDAREAYLVLCSDGISDVMNEDEIATILANEQPENFANRLRQEAFRRSPVDTWMFVDDSIGSSSRADNITALVTPIPKDNQAVAAMVADGHGGNEVSELLKQNFAKTFVAKTAAIAEENNFAKPVIVPLEIKYLNEKVEPLDWSESSEQPNYKTLDNSPSISKQDESNRTSYAWTIAGHLLGFGIGMGLMIGSALLLAGIIALPAMLAPYLLLIAIPALMIGLAIGITSTVSLWHESNKEEAEIPLKRKPRQKKTTANTDEAKNILETHNTEFNLLDELHKTPQSQPEQNPTGTSHQLK